MGSSRSTAIATAAVFVVAAAARTLYLLESGDNPAFATPLVDAETYHRLAVELSRGSGLKETFFWQPVFYPVFLAVVYSGSSIAVRDSSPE